MKKALALILTVAMLLSCVAMSVAAVREFSVTTETTSNKYWQWDADNAYVYIDPVADSDAFTMSMDLRLDTADASFAGYFGNCLTMNASGIGVGGNNLSYTFNVGEWYAVELVTDGSSTVISVNGTEVGTVAAGLNKSWCGGVFYISMDNFYTGKYDEDFEDGTFDNKSDTNGILCEDSNSVTTVVNKNVSKVSEENTYWQWDADNAYVYIDPVADSDAFTMSMDLRLDTADASFAGYFGNCLTMNASGIGVGGNNLSYTFNVGEWYAVELVTDGSSTVISVNGTEVGTVAAGLNKSWCGGVFYISMDNFYTGKYDEDFEDGNFDNKSDTNGVIASEKSETVLGSYDLGNYYWQWDNDNAYVYMAPIADSDDFTMSMDVCLDTVDSSFAGYFGNCLTMNTSGVGVGGNNLPYTFNAGEWYHLVLDTDGSSTVIYVNDVEIGTVAAGLNKDWCGGVFNVSIDNFYTGKYDEDFEDQNFDNKSDTNGVLMEYDFGIVPEETIMDKIAVTTPAGEAILLESDTNSAYMLGYGTNIGKNYAISFDLALIPNDKETPSSNEGHNFELWRTSNGAQKRFTIGTAFAGRDDDTKEYAYIEGMEAGWGEATWNNFHNVIIVFDGNNAELYVDRCLAWSGPAANQFDGVEFIGMLINASAIVDNYTIYDLDGNVIDDSFPTDGNWSGDSYMDPVRVNLDTQNFCADNCHVYGSIERTTKETCTNTGVDTVWCAICGEAKSETEIAMLPHQYNKFDNTRVADGKYYTDCKNCGTRLYSAIPAEDSYTGSIIAYFDMSDAMFGELNNGETEAINSGWFGDQFRYEDGKAILDADSYLANYSEFSFGSHFQQAVSSKGWSYNFRMTYNGLWDTDDVINSNYAHSLHWWLRGVSLELGYNADDEQWYIGPSGNPGAVTIEKATADFKFQEGLTYNIKYGLMFDDDEEYAEITIYVNDELVLIHSVDETGADIYYDCDFGTDVIDTIYCRNFGFAYEMDDLVIGSYDFAWNKVVGDVDNDGVLTAADALMMRRYLAKVIGDADVNLDLMDVNGDGVINAKDQLTLRKALAA